MGAGHRVHRPQVADLVGDNLVDVVVGVRDVVMSVVMNVLYLPQLGSMPNRSRTGNRQALARAAPGCLDFAQSADQLEPDRINIFERWESDAHLEAFRSLPDDGGRHRRYSARRCDGTESQASNPRRGSNETTGPRR